MLWDYRSFGEANRFHRCIVHIYHSYSFSRCLGAYCPEDRLESVLCLIAVDTVSKTECSRELLPRFSVTDLVTLRPLTNMASPNDSAGRIDKKAFIVSGFI